MRPPQNLGHDFAASLVVFLIALPLCLGIAIASGVPPAMGLVAGVIGGIVVGSLSGSPLQISGPAAGLAVIVFELVREHGLPMLGVIVFLAGLLQVVAGMARLGQIFRAITPAVVYGMMAGIGILIMVSQFHVLVDDQPRASGWQNLISIPSAIAKGVMPSADTTHHLAALIGLLTISVMMLWNSLRPQRLAMIPGTLVAVVTATIVDYAFGLPTNNLKLPANLLEALTLPAWPAWSRMLEPHILLEALALAFVASAESLMSAAATDRQHSGPQTDYNRELAAQGAGNLLAGLMGGLPITGVIVRSSANVEAGAVSRWAAVFHGLWLFAAVAAFPSVLTHIPIASLAAVLVYTGYRLVNPEHVRRLATYGRWPVAIYFITMVTIVVTDLLTGVLVGVAASVVKLLLAVSRLTIATTRDDMAKTITMMPIGAMSFFRLGTLSKVLAAVPDGYDLVIQVERLTYVDQSCLEMLANWELQEAARGKSLLVEWDAVAERNWGQARKLARATGRGTLDTIETDSKVAA